MDRAKSRVHCSFRTGMDVVLLSRFSLHVTSVPMLDVYRLFKCSGLAFLGGGRLEAPGEREFQ